ncbi:MAG: cation:proton antiporter, partial [Gammaproteobacteria bacterium]
MQTPQLSSDITTDITLTLCSAVLLSTFLRYFKIPPILIYLLTGIIIGPTGVALVSDSESSHVIAEIGIVFLLFTLGLAFSPPKLLSIKRLVFGLGSIQVGVCFLLFFSVTIAYGLSTLSAILCAIVLALSSTAIVSKELTHLHLLKSRTG